MFAVAERDGALEAELKLLSRAMLGKGLIELSSYEELESTLANGQESITLTLEWGKERQSLVLHELRHGKYKLFDPTHELHASLKAADFAMEPGSSGGTLWVSSDVVKSWFEERSAVALVAEPRELG